MLKSLRSIAWLALALSLCFSAIPARAQLGNSGSIEGVVKDASGGVVANATVEISYAVSGYRRTAATGSDGSFRFTNVPFNTYHLVVTAAGVNAFVQEVDVRSAGATAVQHGVEVGGSSHRGDGPG